MIRRNTLVIPITIATTIILLSCSSPSQENKAVQVSPKSLSPTMISPATPETPTEIPPTITPTPTPEVVELNPSPRGYVSMAYDSESRQVILFGGQTGSIGNTSDETWAYDVTTNEWINMKPSVSPPKGAAGSLVYDVESDRVILNGATDRSTPSRETWTYDFKTNTWTKMAAQGPSQHLGSQMGYDVESDRIILFGGLNPGRSEFYNDTRVYDFNTDTWMKMESDPAPPVRNFHCMSYDTNADRVILWGGDMPVRPKDSSVWAYDYNTNTWEENKTNNGPEVRDYCGMAYSTEADKVFLYGGYSHGSSEMWVYDYNTNSWNDISTEVNPGELSRFAFVYIPVLDEILLFGGQLGDEQYNYTQSTWVYDIQTNTWTETTRHEN